jgi:hypothetical protein
MQGLHHGWKKELETFWPKLEAMVCDGFQAKKMRSHCRVETIRVIMALLENRNSGKKNQIRGVGKKNPLSFWTSRL